MHAILCRKWKSRVKGRDWYDLVWYAANHPELHLEHLEQRMRQTGHWKGNDPLTQEKFQELLGNTINKLDVKQARREVEPFVKSPENLSIWSHEFFLDVATRIKIDGLVKSPKNADLSLRAKRGNLVTSRISVRLPRRFAPRNAAVGLFTRPSRLVSERGIFMLTL